MAYVPPHKRHSKDTETPAPIAESLPLEFQRAMNLRSPRTNLVKNKDIYYANRAISIWFAVGLSDDNCLPSCVNLEPISVESVERERGEKPSALVNRQLFEGDKEVDGDLSVRPWVFIAENIVNNLLSSFEKLRLESDNFEVKKPSFVARIGRVLFLGSPALGQEISGKDSDAETTLRGLRRVFYTNVSSSYMENITRQVVFEEEKDMYIVKLSDTRREGAVISCKCVAIAEGQCLQLYKIETQPVRHLVVDISCLNKNFDLRLMMCARKTKSLDNEMESIRKLISSAVVDPNVKGGLRWPLGKASSGDGYSVVAVWHTVSKIYKSASLKIKVREANRFNFKTSSGEATREITLKLKGIVSKILAAEADSIPELLEENLRLIWDKFLTSESDINMGQVF